MTVLRKKLLLGLMLLGLVSSCFAKSKTLVVYFSCTGTTEKLAKVAANHLGADIFKIEAKIPYTAADLKYYTDCRADKEQNDKSARPEIANKVSNMADYDTVVLAYPIWHGQAPRIISTFLESYDFSGKTIIPFCTSASSGIGNSDTELHKLCSPKAKWIKGMRFGKDTKESELKAFLDRNVGKENQMKIYLTINGKKVSATLVENSSTKALMEKLAAGPVTYEAHDYGNFEKVGDLPWKIPQNNEDISTVPGDLILYQGKSLCIYYDNNSWDFTRIGKLDDMSQKEIKDFVKAGKGNVKVTLSLE